MNIQALVDDAVLDNRVAFSGCHAACTQRVPGGLDVALN